MIIQMQGLLLQDKTFTDDKNHKESVHYIQAEVFVVKKFSFEIGCEGSH